MWIIGASATGLYGVAAKFPALISIVVGIFFQAWQISALETSNSEEQSSFYSNIYNLLWSTLGIFTSIVLVVIRVVVKVLVADNYFVAWEYAPFLLVAAAFSAIQSFLGVNYTIAKDSIGALRSTTIAAICNIVLNYFLIKSIGIQGATIATLSSFIIVTIYRYYDTRKYVKIEVDNKFAFFTTYVLLISESIIMAMEPRAYYISIPVCIAVLLLNRSKIKEIINIINKQLSKKGNS